MITSITKYIGELKQIEINPYWYSDDKQYQRGIDSEIHSILERLKWLLIKNDKNYLFERIEESLESIPNQDAKVSYVINFLNEEFLENYELQAPITNIERVKYINHIASHLQEHMVTTEINAFLGGFSVPTEEVTIVPSKRVYVQDLLKSQPAGNIYKIAKELNLTLEQQVQVSVESIQEYIRNHDLNSIHDDFSRVLKHIDTDPEQAIASCSSTLESICKAIIELEGEKLPKKQNIKGLFTKTIQLIGLDPLTHDDGEIKRVLGGISNVILGVGALRTGYSSAHGHGLKKYKLSTRHVKLLVNSMVSYGTFIIETYLEKRNI